MTIREKTVQYSFAQSTADVATTVARDFTQIAAVVIAETTSRVFKSVILEMWIPDTNTSNSPTAILMGIALGAVARDDVTVTQTLTHSNEATAYCIRRDVTAYFATNYTGTSMTCDARLTMTNITTRNVSAKLIITYEYDDASATTLTKTVRIPIEGNTGNLTTSYATLGGVSNQWPLLDTFCPEQEITFRDLFFQWETHEGTTANSAFILSARYDGATDVNDASNTPSNVTDRHYQRMDKLLGAVSTSAAHDIEAKTSSVTGGPYPALNGHLVVTYTHTITPIAVLNEDLDASETGIDVVSATGMVAPFTIAIDNEHMRVTSIATNTLTVTRGVNGTSGASHSNGAAVLPVVLNSLKMPIGDGESRPGGTSSAEKSRFILPVSIQEPGPILLVQSAAQIWMIDGGTLTISLAVGGQTAKTYTHAPTVRAGAVTQMIRFDAGGTAGSGLSIARGFNDIVVDVFTSSLASNNIGSAMSGVVYLNYYSGLHADGHGVHNHTVAWGLRSNQTGNFNQSMIYTPETVPKINDSNYWINCAGYELLTILVGAAPRPDGIFLMGEVLSAEAEGAGWRALLTTINSNDNEQSFMRIFEDSPDFLKYATQQSDSLLDIEGNRDYKIDIGTDSTLHWQLALWLTYHSITYAIAGDISGSNGGNVDINAYRTDTGDRVGTTSRTGDGAYTITWYDDTVDVFSEAYEDGTHLGRSANGKAA